MPKLQFRQGLVSISDDKELTDHEFFHIVTDIAVQSYKGLNLPPGSFSAHADAIMCIALYSLVLPEQYGMFARGFHECCGEGHEFHESVTYLLGLMKNDLGKLPTCFLLKSVGIETVLGVVKSLGDSIAASEPSNDLDGLCKMAKF